MATRFEVSGGTGNWNSTTNWSTTSGGSSGASVPGTGDDAVFDTHSGNMTFNASSTVGSIDFTGAAGSGAYTGTFTHASGQTLTFDGTGLNVLKLSTGMTYTKGNNATSALSFTGTSGTTKITQNNAGNGSIFGNITQNGAGGTVQLQDTLVANVGAAMLTVTNGTFDANNNNVNIAALTATGGALTMGSGTWSFSGVGNSVMTVAGTTLSAASVTLSFVAPTIAAGATINFGAANTIGTVRLLGPGTLYLLTGNGLTTCTIGTLSITGGAVQVRFNSTTTWTISTSFTVTGLSTGSSPLIAGTVTSAAVPMTVPAGSSLTWAGFWSVAFTGAPTASNSFDHGNNSGITINPPSSSGLAMLVDNEALVG